MPPPGRVTIWDIAEAAGRLAASLAREPPRPLSRGPPGSQLGEAEASEEQRVGGILDSMAPIRSGDKLWPVMVHSLARVEPEHPGRVYAVDAGSRVLEAYTLRLGVYAGAVAYYDGAFTAGTYPDSTLYPYVPAEAPAASLAASLDDGWSLPGWLASEPLVDPAWLAEALPASLCGASCSLLSNLGYGSGYDPNKMLDENREYLENRLLGWIAERATNDTLVLVDGPLFMTPGLLKTLHTTARSLKGTFTISNAVKLLYTLSYLVNTADRVKIVGIARARGAEVVAIVKRVENSKLLVAALEKVVRDITYTPDVELVEAEASRALRGPYGVGRHRPCSCRATAGGCYQAPSTSYSP
ncbi:DNA double-strand break repair nuclease NurA [Hyperthermus butylicus]|uniref:NurA domain-containing protein n=1 Tax=Hyperthermus butylicus (strain DSM 5456 / JCM 9403 / PLM1-5) TaxID=415426 RepID=A2BKK1_HYPBU|nr:DNA double-strand break repair nuclease NurA [Hyperthermus butylicus]ABM80512.1 hypothetical protein Hbut_0656 [Hyperthermus butylicus DSM 5456]